jgi:hypothetical protein
VSAAERGHAPDLDEPLAIAPLTRDEFVEDVYGTRPGDGLRMLRRGYAAVACTCGDDLCLGWAMVLIVDLTDTGFTVIPDADVTDALTHRDQYLATHPQQQAALAADQNGADRA